MIINSRFLRNYSYQFLKKRLPENVVLLKEEERHNALNAADLILCSTGTITLEAALTETPLISAYKFNPLAYRLVRQQRAQVRKHLVLCYQAAHRVPSVRWQSHAQDWATTVAARRAEHLAECSL